MGHPELRWRSTGYMVTNFVLGITFSHKMLVKLRRPFRAFPGLRLHLTQIVFENVTQEKSLILATAAVRLRCP